ncbi:MAG: hypothetical protein INR62_13035, partial [Rhodospirillales bacterium]|nr:hypothetical protein [Acetobacter sp.]
MRLSLQEAVAAQDAPRGLRACQQLGLLKRPADLAFCSTALRKLKGPLLAQGHRLLRTFLVRSVTIEPVLPAFHVEAALHGYVLEVE